MAEIEAVLISTMKISARKQYSVAVLREDQLGEPALLQQSLLVFVLRRHYDSTLP